MKNANLIIENFKFIVYDRTGFEILENNEDKI
jgi:hypothetical protein